MPNNPIAMPVLGSGTGGAPLGAKVAKAKTNDDVAAICVRRLPKLPPLRLWLVRKTHLSSLASGRPEGPE